MTRLQTGGPWRIGRLAQVVTLVAALLMLGLVNIAIAQNGAPTEAQTYPKQIATTVSDYAMVLPEAARQALAARLEGLRAETGVQMAVVTLNGIPGGEAQLESYATGLFNAWGIGRADRNDGILLLYSAPESAVRLELGRAYGQGYDVLAQDIVSRVLVPAFLDGRPTDALTQGTAEVIDRIALPFAAGRAADAPRRGAEGWMKFAVPALMVMAFAAIALRKRRGGGGAQTCPQCGTNLAPDTGPILSNGRSHLASCPNCGWAGPMPLPLGRHERPDPVDRTRGDREGGFGGGSSSGGGASGRW